MSIKKEVAKLFAVKSSATMSPVKSGKAKAGGKTYTADRQSTAYDKGHNLAVTVDDQASKRIDAVREMFTWPIDGTERVEFAAGFKETVDDVLGGLRADLADVPKEKRQGHPVARMLSSRKAQYSRLGTIIRAIAANLISKAQGAGKSEHELYALCPKGNAGRAKAVPKFDAERVLELAQAPMPNATDKGDVLMIEQAIVALLGKAQMMGSKLPVSAMLAGANKASKRTHMRRAA